MEINKELLNKEEKENTKLITDGETTSDLTKEYFN